MKKRFRFGVVVNLLIKKWNICLVARDVREQDFMTYKGWLESIGVADGMQEGPARVYIAWG